MGACKLTHTHTHARTHTGLRACRAIQCPKAHTHTHTHTHVHMHTRTHRFEGLSRDAVPHGMGVMIFGNGTGGGLHFRDVRRGDK